VLPVQICADHLLDFHRLLDIDMLEVVASIPAPPTTTSSQVGCIALRKAKSDVEIRCRSGRPRFYR
jgi:hypothetical protein